MARPLRNVPAWVCASTVMLVCPPLWPTRTSTFDCAPVLIVERTVCAQKRTKLSQFTQFFAQRPVASEVQATARPSPYCQEARMGSF